MKKYAIHSLSLLLLIVSGVFICDSEKDIIPSYSNGSGYRYKILKTKNKVNDSLWVNISISDKSGDFIKYGTQVITGCTKIDVKNGQVSLLLRNVSVESIFTASSIGYFVVETKPFFFQENDSVVINFVLGDYDRPLINCE